MTIVVTDRGSKEPNTARVVSPYVLCHIVSVNSHEIHAPSLGSGASVCGGEVEVVSRSMSRRSGSGSVRRPVEAQCELSRLATRRDAGTMDGTTRTARHGTRTARASVGMFLPRENPRVVPHRGPRGGPRVAAATRARPGRIIFGKRSVWRRPAPPEGGRVPRRKSGFVTELVTTRPSVQLSGKILQCASSAAGLAHP